MGKVIIWTDDEIKFLMENWNEMSASKIGERLGRPASGVRQKGKKLGLKTDAERFEKITGLKIWTKEEDEYLVKSWGKIKKTAIAKKLDRKPESVEKRAHVLGLRMTDDELETVTHMKRWTPEDKEFLIENYGKISLEELSEKLGRKAVTIQRRASTLGLTGNYTNWTESQEDYLQDFWGERSVVSTAAFLNTTVSAVKDKAYKLGLGKQMEAVGKWYTAKDVKELLGVGQRTVYGWMDAGIIKFNKIRVGEKAEYHRLALKNLRIFLETHQDRYDTRNCDLRDLKTIFAKSKINNSDNLIIEDLPKWLEDKIQSDRKKPKRVKPKEWTMMELKRLNDYVKEGHHPSKIAERLNRTHGSVKLKMYTINKESYSL